jgi:hypothetical protein
MDCQNVQAAIDTNITNIGHEEANETIGAHVRGCQDCRRYSDETAVLLTLLGTQPRIEAPADFDFKLRARLARAKSEPAAADGLFDKLHARSWRFSWGQAAAATATLAVIATITTLHLATGDRAMQSKMDESTHRVAEKVAASVSPPVTNAPAVAVKHSFSVVKSRHKTSVAAPIPAAVRTTDPNLATESEDSTEGKDYFFRGFDPENKQFITTQNRALIGAESSASTMSKTLSFVPSI